MYVTKEQIRQARRVSLADYLRQKYPAAVKIVGNSLCLKRNPSLYVKRSISGYHDFSTGEHGNSIDFLMHYKGMAFTEAVLALCEFDANSFCRNGLETLPVRFALPTVGAPPFTRVRHYLTNRGIPTDMVEYLIEKQLLYEDALYGNAVFVNPQRDYCEIRGTGKQKFHGCWKLKPNRFWYLILGNMSPDRAFICESAIDAVSLMVIQSKSGYCYESAVYISIGGVANQQTIDRIKSHIPSTLAVDNDPAGQACRDRNPDLTALIPTCKDWNDVLCHL